MKSNIFKILVFLFLNFVISFIVIEGLIIYEGEKKDSNKVDYVIILGARLYGERPSPALLERLKVAEIYLKDNEDVKAIVSGGQGINEDIPEAHAMKKHLVSQGIDEDRIIIEDESTTTFENLKFSIDKMDFKQENIEIMIATNKYHIFRSKLLAKRLGLVPYGLPGKIPPSIVLQSYVREYFALIKSILFDRVYLK